MPTKSEVKAEVKDESKRTIACTIVRNEANQEGRITHSVIIKDFTNPPDNIPMSMLTLLGGNNRGLIAAWTVVETGRNVTLEQLTKTIFFKMRDHQIDNYDLYHIFLSQIKQNKCAIIKSIGASLDYITNIVGVEFDYHLGYKLSAAPENSMMANKYWDDFRIGFTGYKVPTGAEDWPANMWNTPDNPVQIIMESPVNYIPQQAEFSDGGKDKRDKYLSQGRKIAAKLAAKGSPILDGDISPRRITGHSYRISPSRFSPKQ